MTILIFQFVLALCGTITNIAASAPGRDFLVKDKQGVALLDTYVSVLQESNAGHNTKLKSLIVMALYNVRYYQETIEIYLPYWPLSVD